MPTYFTKSTIVYESSAPWNDTLNALDSAGLGWNIHLACSRCSTCACDFCYTEDPNPSMLPQYWMVISGNIFNSSFDAQVYCDQVSLIIQMDVKQFKNLNADGLSCSPFIPGLLTS
jgi:hypothetical protein